MKDVVRDWWMNSVTKNNYIVKQRKIEDDEAEEFQHRLRLEKRQLAKHEELLLRVEKLEKMKNKGDWQYD